LKLALKYKMPIVPVASAGVDDRFIGLNDGHAWGRKLKMPGGAPFWIGIGLGGVFPFALPLPSKIHTMVATHRFAGGARDRADEPEHFEELHGDPGEGAGAARSGEEPDRVDCSPLDPQFGVLVLNQLAADSSSDRAARRLHRLVRATS
jgi:hypothetical protein